MRNPIKQRLNCKQDTERAVLACVFQVEILEQSSNLTVGYYVTRGRLVFTPAAAAEKLLAYGLGNATADMKQHVPHLQAVVALALPWQPLPAQHFQLKTGE